MNNKYVETLRQLNAAAKSVKMSPNEISLILSDLTLEDQKAMIEYLADGGVWETWDVPSAKCRHYTLKKGALKINIGAISLNGATKQNLNQWEQLGVDIADAFQRQKLSKVSDKLERDNLSAFKYALQYIDIESDEYLKQVGIK